MQVWPCASRASVSSRCVILTTLFILAASKSQNEAETARNYASDKLDTSCLPYVNMVGGDRPNMPLPMDNATTCEQACIADSGCNLYTFTGPKSPKGGGHGSAGCCWLKHEEAYPICKLNTSPHVTFHFSAGRRESPCRLGRVCLQRLAACAIQCFFDMATPCGPRPSQRSEPCSETWGERSLHPGR